MFFGFGLSGRGVFGVLRPTPRPHGGGVRQHLRRRKSACRLGGHVFGGVGNRVVFEIARREADLGARPPSRRLHPPRNRRGYAAVAGFVHRPQRIQGAGIGGVKGGTPRRGGAGSSRIAAKRHRTGRRGRLDQQTAQSRRIASRKKIHRGDRFGHPARNAKAGARQRIYCRPDGGQRWKLQKLRVLPVDGNEFAGRHQTRPDKRTQRNPVGQKAGRSRQTAFAAYARLRGRTEEKRCVQRHGTRLICRPYCRFRRPLKQGQHHANRLRRIDCRKRAGGTDARPVAA